MAVDGIYRGEGSPQQGPDGSPGLRRPGVGLVIQRERAPGYERVLPRSRQGLCPGNAKSNAASKTSAGANTRATQISPWGRTTAARGRSIMRAANAAGLCETGVSVGGAICGSALETKVDMYVPYRLSVPTDTTTSPRKRPCSVFSQ